MRDERRILLGSERKQRLFGARIDDGCRKSSQHKRRNIKSHVLRQGIITLSYHPPARYGHV